MSSDDIVLNVEGVSKRYELFAEPKDQLKQMVFPPLQRVLGLKPSTYFREFWALREISFSLKRGQSCGIVGLNGSGKSTLLQIIAGTLSPTNGEIQTEGRIFAMLELGSGFNPDFTGRENARLNAAILGLSTAEIDDKIEEIERFADIGEHFDQPLRSYSSGMQVRVAFAVATVVNPDILIVDEALSVGDAYFQQKCFAFIDRFRAGGVTLLFVSHSAQAVKELCDTAILLSHGQLIDQGSPKAVIDRYNGLVAQIADTSGTPISIRQSRPLAEDAGAGIDYAHGMWTKATTVVTNNQAELVDVRVLDHKGDRIEYVESESTITFQYVVRFRETLDRPAYGIIVRDKLGRSIFETSSFAMGHGTGPVSPGEVRVIRFTMPFNLRAGQYSFSVGIANRGFARSEFEEHSLLMHDVEQVIVVEAESAIHYGGVFNMNPSFEISQFQTLAA